ncbi:hypothetical protein HaLaN_07879, partial [Haematococcus lacustris]
MSELVLTDLEAAPDAGAHQDTWAQALRKAARSLAACPLRAADTQALGSLPYWGPATLK